RTLRRGQREGGGQGLGLGNFRGMVRLRRRRSARPLRLPVHRLVAEKGSLLHTRRQNQVVLHAGALSRDRVASLPKSRRRPVRGRDEEDGRLERESEGVGGGSL